MAEVTNQLAPLVKELSRVSGNQERLYNSNGGPPGFLQTARKEDEGTFKMIFDMLNDHKEEMEPVKQFIQDHAFEEKVRARERSEDDKRFNRKMAKWMMAITLLLGILELIAHRGELKHSLLTVDAPNPTLNATIPALTR